MRPSLVIVVTLAASFAVLLTDPPPHPVVTRIERAASVEVHGRGGSPPLYAFAGGAAPRLTEEGADNPAAVIGEVFREDVLFEGALRVLEDSASEGLNAPRAEGDPVLTRWQERGADGVLTSEVTRQDATLRLAVRVYDVASGRLAFAREYLGPAEMARTIAHLASDELHADQADVTGVATTRLAFVSDRAGSRREPTGYMRRVKEIYVADYDGANQRRVTGDGDIVLAPSWSPDGSSIAYTSFRGGFQNIVCLQLAGQRRASAPAGRGRNWLSAWSPDGSKIAFTSSRDGNEEIYVVRPDGSELVRLTRHWAIDTSPAWSPDGRQIAFTSGRSGSPQIWVMNADGGEQRQFTAERYCDRPTWSSAPYDEIAYVSRTKTGFDVKVKEVASGAERQLTFGHGFNESPAWSPTGRHLAFTTTRAGGQQIWTMTRNGERPRPVTRIGNNSMPAWSR